jgi:hypothetical protein
MSDTKEYQDRIKELEDKVARLEAENAQLYAMSFNEVSRDEQERWFDHLKSEEK